MIMKLLCIIPILLISCTKDWECCTHQTTTGSYDSEMTSCIDFRGTNEEKNEFEDEGTSTKNLSGMTITQKTNCKPD